MFNVRNKVLLMSLLFISSIISNVSGMQPAPQPTQDYEIYHIRSAKALKYATELKQLVRENKNQEFEARLIDLNKLCEDAKKQTPAEPTFDYEPSDLLSIIMHNDQTDIDKTVLMTAAQYGNHEALNLILDYNKQFTLETGDLKKSLLNIIIAKLLPKDSNSPIKKLASATDLTGNTALHWASFGQFIQEKCLGVNKDQATYYTKTSLDYVTCIKLLIKEGYADVNATNRTGETALHNAAASPYPDIVKALISHNANINAMDQFGKNH